MTGRSPKPEGMMWLNPYFIVTDVKRAIDFYEKAFGFQTRLTLPDKTGGIMHAEMSYKDSVMMIGAESARQNQLSPKTLSGSPVSFYLYVDNVNDFFEKAKKAGAESICEPKDQFWGDRTCSVRCPEGYQWTFAQNVADFDASNAPE